MKSYADSLCALFVCFFINIFSSNALATENIDLLLVAYDQGESNAFKQLEKALKKRGINYRILSIGRAAEIFRNHPLNLTISVPDPEQLRNNRETVLPRSALAELSQRINPKIVYSGMASAAQAQILNHMKANGSYTLAFYDNFDPITNKKYVQAFLETIRTLDKFHIPSSATAVSFKDLVFCPNPLYVIIGQPALEAWDDIYRQTDNQFVRLELNLGPNEPVVVFAGGYDDTYEEYFRVFIEATRKLPSVTFLVTHHPKTSGEVERRWIKERGAGNVRLVENNRNSTAVLTKISVAVMVHKSSIGTMALYKGKPVIYIAEPGTDNFLIRQKAAFLASTPKEVVKKFQSAIASDKQFFSLESLGIPDQPSLSIAIEIETILEDMRRSESDTL
ncbi:hypothetical protein [Endozoicomonas sp. 8E]|uniref:hypothetical protein n=1 Tax=Endozoicomonas sp. 8E TaxID=3035692 RepID=UPI00293924EF|nr:hypothetical protein [Endozoicomonas sp. 8E]WOG29343.1 hypothetical protein P6910_06735 [Endozoicomonas sp. 8E]